MNKRWIKEGQRVVLKEKGQVKNTERRYGLDYEGRMENIIKHTDSFIVEFLSDVGELHLKGIGFCWRVEDFKLAKVEYIGGELCVG